MLQTATGFSRRLAHGGWPGCCRCCCSGAGFGAERQARCSGRLGTAAAWWRVSAGGAASSPSLLLPSEALLLLLAVAWAQASAAGAVRC